MMQIDTHALRFLLMLEQNSDLTWKIKVLDRLGSTYYLSSTITIFHKNDAVQS